MIRLLLALPLLLGGTAASAQSHLLVVSGLGGEPQYEKSFHEWAMTLADAAERGGLPAANVTVLTDKPDLAPGKVDGRSTRDAVLGAVRAMAGRAGPRTPSSSCSSATGAPTARRRASASPGRT